MPVAEAGLVVPAPSEPAIIEHEAFDAERCRALSQRDQPFSRQVEAQRFPRIEVDLARAPSSAVGQQARAQEAVEGLRQGRAVGGEREHRFGRRDILARLQHHFACVPCRPHQEHRPPVARALAVGFERQPVIAAPAEMCGQHFPVLLAWARMQQQPVCAAETGLAGGALARQTIRRDGAAVFLHLARPAAGIAGQFGEPRRYGQGERGEAFHLQRRCAAIGQRQSDRDDIARADHPAHADADAAGPVFEHELHRPRTRGPALQAEIGRDPHPAAPQIKRGRAAPAALAFGQQAGAGRHIGLAFMPPARCGGAERCEILACGQARAAIDEIRRPMLCPPCFHSEDQRQRLAIQPHPLHVHASPVILR